MGRRGRTRSTSVKPGARALPFRSARSGSLAGPSPHSAPSLFTARPSASGVSAGTARRSITSRPFAQMQHVVAGLVGKRLMYRDLIADNGRSAVWRAEGSGG